LSKTDVNLIANEARDFFGESDSINYKAIKERVEPIPGLPLLDGYGCPTCESKYFTSIGNFSSYVHSEKDFNVDAHKSLEQKLNRREKNSIVIPILDNCPKVEHVTGLSYESVLGEIDLNYSYGKTWE
jgi:hypothetical protein